MPLFESKCTNERCRLYGIEIEHYYHNAAQPMNPCKRCGGPTQKIEASRFGIVFTGVISARYNDRDKEGANREGHWAFEKDPAGKTKPVFLETWQDQKEFCARNKLANPKEMPANYTVAEDGKTVLNTRGLPGTEI